MPSVYTMEGATSRRKKKKTPAQAAQQKRFRNAAKRCKGQNLKAYRACMRRELKKKR